MLTTIVGVEQDRRPSGNPAFLAREANTGKTFFFVTEINNSLGPGFAAIGSFKEGFFGTDKPAMLEVVGKSNIGKGRIGI